MQSLYVIIIVYNNTKGETRFLNLLFLLGCEVLGF